MRLKCSKKQKKKIRKQKKAVNDGFSRFQNGQKKKIDDVRSGRFSVTRTENITRVSLYLILIFTICIYVYNKEN